MSVRTEVTPPGQRFPRKGSGGRRSPSSDDSLPNLSRLGVKPPPPDNEPPDSRIMTLTPMPTFFELASTFYSNGISLITRTPTRINLVDGSNLFYFNRETHRFDFLDGSPRSNRPRELDEDAVRLGRGTPLEGDRVDAIVVMNPTTYYHVSNNRAQAGEILKKVVGDDGMVFFLVPKIRDCNETNTTNCLARYRKENKPVECRFFFPHSHSGKGHMYCEYDDIILHRLYKELGDTTFARFSRWKADLASGPAVRIITGDRRLHTGANRNWAEVLKQLKSLGQTLEIDIIAPNPQAYHLDQ
jgi:hypothetical protein